MSKSQLPWWRGTRGEWYEILQIVLILLVVFGPATLAGYPKWPASTPYLSILGVSLLVSGIALGAIAIKRLQSSGALKPGGALLTDGPYQHIRHPLYTAQMFFAFGWALALGGWLTTLYALLLTIVLNFKSLMEERRLLQRFPEYRDYQSRTKKFVSFIY